MHDEHTTPHSTEHAEKLGYEDTDVSIPVLLKWFFFLVVFVGVTSVIVLGIYAMLVPQLLDHNIKQASESVGHPTMMLQPDPIQDIKKFRREESERTGEGTDPKYSDPKYTFGYGTWKDGDGNEVNYIPIERAMQIVEAKGLPIETPDSAKNDVTPPAVDRGFVNDPLPDGTQPGVQGKTGPANGDNMDDTSYTHHTPGM